MSGVKQEQNKNSSSNPPKVSPIPTEEKTNKTVGAQHKIETEIILPEGKPSLIVMHAPTRPTYRSAGRKAAGLHRRPKAKRRKQTGWSTNKSLEWREVKEINAAIHHLSYNGFELNVFVSIRPEDGISDQPRKRACYRIEDALRKRLRRRRIPFIGLRVFEKPVGGLLHLHALINVPRGRLKEVLSLSDLPRLHIIEAKSYHISYITKQRRPLPPSIELRVQHKRQRGLPFRGQRWSLTKEAKALLNSQSAG